MHQPKHLSQHLPAKAIGTTTPSTRQDGCHFCLPTPSPVSHHPPPVSNLLAIQPLAFNTSTHTKPSRTAQRLGVPFFWYLDGGHLPHATSCQPSHSEKNQTLSLRHQSVWIDGRIRLRHSLYPTILVDILVSPLAGKEGGGGVGKDCRMVWGR